MPLQRFWLQVIAFLALVWAGVGVVMWVTEDSVFSSEKTLALMADAPWLEDEDLAESKREAYLDKVINTVIKLDFNQRNTMREDGLETMDHFFKSLTDEEKGEYVNRTVEENFKAVMKGLEKLPAEDRRRIIGGIQREMKKKSAKNPEMQMMLDQDAAGFEKSFTKDMGLFFKEAPLSMKLEMAPMLEAMQGRMQGMRIR
ncbi:MAG: hypothetical protein K9N47_04290 [Prosthecobacter sp.]|uniref:hypothetical protein n=1 Tax=Prosthecobacter sp. TaxID=1965333 RepID=UPI0025EF5BB5|nr:hypothetical protein [Prosthecobacter sp.]MCF7785315.1 hypothetical protein [Prosthecobacter sp.]